MWQYQKRLQYPVNIKATDPRLAQLIIAQYGGPDGNCLSSVPLISKIRILAFSHPRRPL